VPKDSGREPELQRIEISDPAAHTKHFCRVATPVCTLEDYAGPSALAADNGDAAEVKYGTFTREDLGKNVVYEVDAIGARETRTLNPGAIENSAPLSIGKEFWYSPQLGINVAVKRLDPRHGTEQFLVIHISLTEPDPKLFTLPTGTRWRIGGRSRASVRPPPRGAWAIETQLGCVSRDRADLVRRDAALSRLQRIIILHAIPS
jgi:hypothetical protein